MLRARMRKRSLSAAAVTGAALIVLANPAFAGTYTVTPGDTLGGIGRQTGVSVSSLAAANGLRSPFVLHPGQRLHVPSSGGKAAVKTAKTTVKAATNAPAPAKTVTTTGSYVATRGDTLSRIGSRHGVSVAALMAANGLKDTRIRAGQVLHVPGLKTTTVLPLPTSHAVAPRTAVGQSLDRWSAKYAMPADLPKGLAWVESGWTSNAVSSAGAIGVMQLMPATTDWVGRQLVRQQIDPWNADQNVHGGVAYLDWLLHKTGSERSAIASYFQGYNSVLSRGPTPAARTYVANVEGARRRFG